MQTLPRQFLTAGTRKLEVARIAAARPGLPELVFLHEGLGSIALWRNFPATLAQRTGCGATVYSRYGNGFSDVLSGARNPEYMHDEALVTLPLVLEGLGIRDAILIGHSDGGSIALIFAAEHPSAVRALVLEAPHLFVEDVSVASIAAMRTHYESAGLRERMARYHADADRTFYGWNDVWLSPHFRDWNVESHVASVAVPVLAIQGLEDEYGTVAQIDAIVRLARGPVDRLTLAGCGHAPHRDRSGVVEGAVTGWIGERLRP
jgi:pimeloyl-ACP methyl ester carboxylesterase